MIPRERSLPRACPRCTYVADCHAPGDDTMMDTLKPGDVTMCLNCGLLERFNDNMVKYEVSPQEYDAFPDDVKATIAYMELKRIGFQTFKRLRQSSGE